MKYSLLKRQSERMEASACGDISKPQTREPCHGDCLLKNWQYSAWSQVQSVDDVHEEHSFKGNSKNIVQLRGLFSGPTVLNISFVSEPI